MARDDVEFTFGADEFEALVKKIDKGMDSIVKNMQNRAKDIDKGVTRALGKFAVLGTAVVGAFKLMRSAIRQYIPEIGSTFSIIGKIVGRNLLFPLRKELIPVLQSLLNWTSRNRKLFTEIGTVLASVFRLIKTAFVSLFRLVQPIIKSIRDFLTGIFGDTYRTITETINLVVFKLTTLAVAAQAILQPMFDNIAGLISSLLMAVQRFTEGFIEGFGKLEDNSARAQELLSGLTELMGNLKEAIDNITPALNVLGKVIGTVIYEALRGAVEQANALLDVINELFNVIKNPADIGGFLSKLGGAYLKGAVSASPAALGVRAATSLIGSGKRREVEDVIITKRGEVIETSPQDTIAAFKGSPSGVSEINVNFPGINVNVTEGNARQAGENLARGLEEGIRTILLDNMVSRGVS